MLRSLEFTCLFGFSNDEIVLAVANRLILVNLLKPTVQPFDFLSTLRDDLVSHVDVHVDWHSTENDLILSEALPLSQLITVEVLFVDSSDFLLLFERPQRVIYLEVTESLIEPTTLYF